MGFGNLFFNWLAGFIFKEYSVEDILLVPLCCYLLIAGIGAFMQFLGWRYKRNTSTDDISKAQEGEDNNAFENDIIKQDKVSGEITRL